MAEFVVNTRGSPAGSFALMWRQRMDVSSSSDDLLPSPLEPALSEVHVIENHMSMARLEAMQVLNFIDDQR